MNESKLSLLMGNLTEFYQNKSYINDIKTIVDQNNIISLRILDWFITNYSKKNQIIINDNFNVYQNYKLMLKSFSKKAFDPFCRKNKIIFYYGEEDHEYLETSCGQLCFFRWCFQHKILEYVRANLEIIEHDMKTSLKNKHKTLTDSDIKKRQPLSISASRTINKHHVKYVVHFD